MANKSILMYGDVQIYEEDLASVGPGMWLNDTILEFEYEFFEIDAFSDQSSIAFIRPAIVYLMTQFIDPDSLEGVLPPDLNSKQLIFLPINDNQGDQAGGSHWSLLVYYRPTNAFYYYDSLHDANRKLTETYKSKLAKLINTSPQSFFVPIPTPQQENGFDCGIYVLAITELLAKRYQQIDKDLTMKPGDNALWRISNSNLTAEHIQEFREALFVFISELATNYL